jgi:hypothetical protein
MVVAFIVVGTYIKPQHRLSNLCGHKKDEELRDTDKNIDINMVPGWRTPKLLKGLKCESKLNSEKQGVEARSLACNTLRG